jgi:hypothetical protein
MTAFFVKAAAGSEEAFQHLISPMSWLDVEVLAQELFLTTKSLYKHILK